MPCRYSRSFTFLLISSALFASAARPLSSPAPFEDSSALTKCTDNEKGRHSYFWTVQHPSINGTVHLFGYFRVAANLIWDSVSPEAKGRFSASNVVVFESDNEGIEQLAECIRQQKINETEQLSASLWERLDGYLNRSKEQSPIPGVQWGQVSTEWLLPFLLHVLSHRELSSVAKEDEIDLKLNKQATEQSKQLEFIEHVPELCNYLPSFSHPQLESAVEHLLDELEMTEEKGVDLQQSSTRRAVMLYGCGELEPADDLIGQSFLSPNARLKTEELRRLNRMLFFDIVTLRNKRWINKIVRLMEENSQKRIFFAFGSSHLLGEGSIVQLLRERGFVVVEQQLAKKSADPGERSGQTETAKSASDQLLGDSLWVIFGVLATIPCFIALFLIIRCLRIEAEPKDEMKLNGNGKRRPSIKLLSNATNGHFANNVTVYGGNDTVSEDKNGHFANNVTVSGGKSGGNDTLSNGTNGHFANNVTVSDGNDTVSDGNDALSNGTNGHFANNVTVSGGYVTVPDGNDAVSEGKNDHLANNDTLSNATNDHFANDVTVSGGNDTVAKGKNDHFQLS
uniref:Metalloprotease TIKI homolog n=1 Tax=Globodera rostochiensis TaxID=31243 RepID=A0A914GVW1_GLORO